MAKTQTVQRLPAGALKPSALQPRRVNEQSPKFRELLASVSEIGVTEPIVARPLPEGEAYEILSGHRRHRAAELAQTPFVPVQILDDCPDERASEIIMASFLGREDLAPIEEYQAVRMLLEAHAGSAERVAKLLGKSLGHVRRILKVEDLSDAWRKAIADPENAAATWSAAHLALVARFPAPRQDEILARVPTFYGDCPELGDLEDHLSQELHALDLAKWDMADATLCKAAGACETCLKRTSAQPGLFDALDAEAAGDAKRGPASRAPADRCLDADCWAAKEKAWLKKREAELKAKHPGLQRMPKNPWHLQGAKKSDKDATPMLVTSGKDAGEVRYVKPAPGCAQVAADKAKRAKGPTVEERLEKLKIERDAYVREKIADLLRNRGKKRAWTYPGGVEAAAIIACLGSAMEWDEPDEVLMERVLKMQPQDALETALDEVLNAHNEALIDCKAWIVQKVCELLRLPLAALEAEALQKLPTPADLAADKLEADRNAAADKAPTGAKAKRQAKAKKGVSA